MEFSKPVPKYQLQGGSSGGAGDAVAPMPGVIEKVFLSNRVFEIQLNFKVMVEEGAAVAAGDPLMVMIAMKMEYVIKVTFTQFRCWSKEHGQDPAHNCTNLKQNAQIMLRHLLLEQCPESLARLETSWRRIRFQSHHHHTKHKHCHHHKEHYDHTHHHNHSITITTNIIIINTMIITPHPSSKHHYHHKHHRQQKYHHQHKNNYHPSSQTQSPSVQIYHTHVQVLVAFQAEE